MTRKFWVSPSGRIHSMATCTGGPGRRRMKSVMLTQDQVLAKGKFPGLDMRCRCATWGLTKTHKS